MAINLGDINFGLGADTRRLQAARDAVLAFGRSVNSAAKAQGDSARAVEALMRKQEASILSALQKTLNLNETIRSATNNSAQIRDVTRAFEQLVAELGKGPVSALAYQRAMEAFQATTSRVTRAIKEQKREAASAAAESSRISKDQLQTARAGSRELARLSREQQTQQRNAAQLAFTVAAAHEQAAVRTIRTYSDVSQAVEKFKQRAFNVGAPVELMRNVDEAALAFRTRFKDAGTSRIMQEETVQQFRKDMLSLNQSLDDYAAKAREDYKIASTAAKIAAREQVKAQKDAIKEQANAQKQLELQQKTAAQIAFSAARNQESAILQLRGAFAQVTAQVKTYQNAVGRIGAPASLSTRAQTAETVFQTAYADAGSSRIAQREALITFRTTLADLRKELTAYQDSLKVTERETATLAKASTDAYRAISTALEQHATSLRKQMSAFSAAENAVNRYNSALNNTRGIPDRTVTNLQSRASTAYETYKTSYSAAGDNRTAQLGSTLEFRKTMQGLSAELAKYRKDAILAGGATTTLESSMRRLADISILLAGPLSGVATRLTLLSSLTERVNFGVAAFTVGIAASLAGLGMLARGAIEASRALDKAEQALIGLTGSQVVAQNEMAYVATIARRAGSGIAETANQYTRLTAASRGTNLEGQATRTIFENILFASQKMGASTDELMGSLRAVEQIMSKGKVTAEELRQQLGDRMPGAIAIMAQALGVTTAELDNMMKKGQITSAALVQFAITAAKRLGVDVSQPINTIGAAEKRASDAILLFNRRLDESIGISKAYMNALNGFANVMDTITKNIGIGLQTLGGIAAGVSTYMLLLYGPTVITGFITLVGTIRAATVAMLGLNAAANSNPFVSIASIILRLTLAIGGAIVGFKLFEQAVTDTGKAHTGAMASVEDYIKSQQALKTTISATTQEYIKQQKVFLAGAQAQLDALDSEYGKALLRKRMLENPEVKGMPDNISPDARAYGIYQSDKVIAEYEKKRAELQDQIKAAEGNVKKLDEIYAEQIKAEEKLKKDLGTGIIPGTADKGENRRALAIKDAYDTIREAEQQLKVFQGPRYMQEWNQIQLDINKQVEDFRDKLTKAQVPAEQVAQLTERFGKALRDLKEGKYYIDNTKNAFDILASAISGGLDKGMESFIDAIIEGEDAMKALANTGKQMIAELLKDFIRFGALNPIKNMLFGGDPSTGKPFPTLSWFGGNSGGLLGGLVSGIFGLNSGPSPTTIAKTVGGTSSQGAYTGAWNAGFSSALGMGGIGSDAAASARTGLSTLANARASYAAELSNPDVVTRLFARVASENGGPGATAQIESMINRGIARGQSMTEVMGGSYWAKDGTANMNRMLASGRVPDYTANLREVMAGSNVSNYATGNASYAPGNDHFNKYPFGVGGVQTSTINGEKYGQEAGTVGWQNNLGNPQTTVAQQQFTTNMQTAATTTSTFDQNLKTVTDTTNQFGDNITKAADNVNLLDQNAQAVSSGGQNFASAVTNTGQTAQNASQGLMGGFTNLLQGIWNAGASFISGLGNAFMSIVKSIGTGLFGGGSGGGGGLFGGIFSFFTGIFGGGKARGGLIQGPGSGTSDTAGLFALSNGNM